MCEAGFGARKLTGRPVRGYRQWANQGGVLVGVRDTPWDARTDAVCSDNKPAPEIDRGTHGCGMWGRWRPEFDGFHMGEKPVVGVIEGTGRKVGGHRGWRAQHARIVALHLAYEYVRPERNGFGYEPAGQEAEDRLAEDQVQLEARYPGVKFFGSLDAMKAAYPPEQTTRYLP